MKKTTLLRIVCAIAILFSTTLAYSQDIIYTGDIYDDDGCPSTSCTAGDVEITSVYLGDVNGNRLTDCLDGDVYADGDGDLIHNSLYLWVVIPDAGPKYDLHFQFNYVVDGNVIDLTTVGDGLDVGEKLTFKVPGLIQEGNYRMVKIPSYTCGEDVLLSGVYMAWATGGHADGDTNCASTSKCTNDFILGIDVETPITASFDYEVLDCAGSNSAQQVVYTNTTTGGSGNNLYTWSFPGQVSVSPSGWDSASSYEGSYTVTYAAAGDYTATLSVEDGDGIVDDSSANISGISVESCCNIEVTNVSVDGNVSCKGGSNG